MLRNILSAAVLLVGLHSAAFAQSQNPTAGSAPGRRRKSDGPRIPFPPAPGPALRAVHGQHPMRARHPRPPVAPPPGQTFAPAPYLHFTNQTLRQVVRTSIGGSSARVVLSNAYGTAPVTIGAAHIALRDKDSAIQAPGRPLTFSGRPTVTIPANAVIYSDPVDLTVPQLADLAIDLYLPGTTNTPATLTMHGGALQTNYISETGNHAGKPTLPTVGRTQSWFLLSRVDVVGARSTSAPWSRSATRLPTARDRRPTRTIGGPITWRRRLLAQGIKMGVLNAGIGGNRVLSEGSGAAGHRRPGGRRRHQCPGAIRAPRALAPRHHARHRARRHQRHRQRAAESDADGRRSDRRPQAADRSGARARMKIYGATLTPFWGAAYYTEAGEAKRQALNEWIRTGKALRRRRSISTRRRAIRTIRRSSSRSTIRATTCIRATRATKPWGRPSTCRCSGDQHL